MHTSTPMCEDGWIEMLLVALGPFLAADLGYRLFGRPPAGSGALSVPQLGELSHPGPAVLAVASSSIAWPSRLHALLLLGRTAMEPRHQWRAALLLGGAPALVVAVVLLIGDSPFVLIRDDAIRMGVFKAVLFWTGSIGVFGAVLTYRLAMSVGVPIWIRTPAWLWASLCFLLGLSEAFLGLVPPFLD